MLALKDIPPRIGGKGAGNPAVDRVRGPPAFRRFSVRRHHDGLGKSLAGIEQAATGYKRGNFQCADHTSLLIIGHLPIFVGSKSPLGPVSLRRLASRVSSS
jgi:hypothetical protein